MYGDTDKNRDEQAPVLCYSLGDSVQIDNADVSKSLDIVNVFTNDLGSSNEREVIGRYSARLTCTQIEARLPIRRSSK